MTVSRRSDSNAPQVPTIGDLALAAALLVVAVLSGLFIDAARPDTVQPSTWWHWALIINPALLVAVRRINPVVVTIMATVVQAGIWISDLPEVLLSIIVVLYTAASEAGRQGLQVAIGSGVVLTIVTGIGVRIAEDVTVYQLPLIALTCGTAVTLGVIAARQRETAEQLAAVVVESRLRSEHERSQAVVEERTHIARELHDIIGHTLSVIAVRAEAADRVSPKDPDAAPAAVTAIAAAARSALGETRRVLSGLRQTSTVDLMPPPDFDAIRGVVTDLESAGVDVTLAETGCHDNTPPAFIVGGAYRIVQESLTNALRHGGPDVTVSVRIECNPTHLDINVTNSIASAAITPATPTSGAGIVGMAERASVLGGTLDARQVDDFFVVDATLPTGIIPNDKARP